MRNAKLNHRHSSLNGEWDYIATPILINNETVAYPEAVYHVHHTLDAKHCRNVHSRDSQTWSKRALTRQVLKSYAVWEGGGVIAVT